MSLLPESVKSRRPGRPPAFSRTALDPRRRPEEGPEMCPVTGVVCVANHGRSTMLATPAGNDLSGIGYNGVETHPRSRAGTMIRKATIVILSAAALMTLGVGLVSRWTPIQASRSSFADLPFSAVYFVECSEGKLYVGRSYMLEQPPKFMPFINLYLLHAYRSSFDQTSLVSHRSSDAPIDPSHPDRRRILQVREFMKALRRGVRLGQPFLIDERLSVHLCVPLIVFAAYPPIAFIRGPLRRYRRRRKGLCVACGYDLRGTVTGICSECGHSIFPKPITTEQETD